MLFRLFSTRILGLPFWWYDRGFKIVVNRLLNSVRDMSRTLALRVWMKNLFIPMYGDTSFTGKMISFMIRLIMIIVRGIVVIIFTITMFLFFFVYLLIFPLTILGFVYHFYGIFV